MSDAPTPDGYTSGSYTLYGFVGGPNGHMLILPSRGPDGYRGTDPSNAVLQFIVKDVTNIQGTVTHYQGND